MPLPGGATDKFGNRYEGIWTVECMIRVMDEKADSIRLEPPGAEGDGVEFRLSVAGNLEYHQVKRQHSASGRWTLFDLKSKKILLNFWEKLKNPTATCVFVSGHAAFQLEELADRARSSISWQEFYDEFLKAGKAKDSIHLKNFQELCNYWSGASNQEEVYKALKRIYVKTIDEQTLKTTVDSFLATLVDGDAANARDVIAQYALDEIHHELIAHDIWQHLKKRGFRRRQWNKDPHVWAAVDKVNHLYFSRFENEKVAGEIIPRDEVSVVVDSLLSSHTKRGVLLTGEAGVGKSGVIGQVATELRSRQIPLIAFRIDRLEPTQSPDALGQQLERLPGSPASVLSAISQGRDCVLLIDQLDAVSEASGRNPWFFECIDKIIKQAQSNPNIHLLLACRKFDLENDSRLKRLAGKDSVFEIVTVKRLSHETVRQVCQELGLDATRLNQKQLDLLSVPLHLSLLAEVTEDERIDVLSFKTANDLYDYFWNYKQRVLENRLDRPAQWTKVIDVLCDYMSSQQKQSLSAPQDIVDDYAKDAEAMASEHILNWQDKRISFFHEGFFDYAFARRFAARGHNLLDFLRSSEQHLFRRAQVRQILFHERDIEFERYLDDLSELLHSSDIRFHLKQVVLALLAALENPREEDWEVLCPFLEDPSSPINPQVWQTLYSSASWFQLIDSLGIVDQWLNSENEEWIDRITILLSKMQRHLPNRVAEFLEPYIETEIPDSWRNRLILLMQWGDVSASRQFFELFLRLIDQGVLDEVRGPIAANSEFWNLIYPLPKQHPSWACEVIRYYLNRRLSLSLASDLPNPFDRERGTIYDGHFAESVFVESARNAPEAYISNVLPFMIKVMELTTDRQKEPPWQDPIWRVRPYGTGHGMDSIILGAMVIALSSVAKSQPETFWTIAESHLIHSSFKTVQYLLVRAFTANAARFADEAINYLCENPVRLATGYSFVAGNAHPAPFLATKELLEAATQHCSTNQLEKLETVILEFYTAYEKSIEGKWFYGYPQLVLLEGIAPNRRSERTNRRLEEWQRKFAGTPLLDKSGKVEPPKSVEARSIESPISKEAASKMTDEQWLKAIAKYNNVDIDCCFQGGRLHGGAYQLSSVLQEQVKVKPVRFAELVRRFPSDTSPYYFDAVLRGIAEPEVEVDIQTALSVCVRCHQVLQHPCGDSISWLFQKSSHFPWSLTAFDILTYYALNDSDPEQESWRTSAPGGGVYYGGDIHMAGINSTRGSAMSAIASLIFADKDRVPHFLHTLQQAVSDSSIAVRTCVAEALIATLNYDRNLAVNLFLELCETEDILLGTQPIEYFLYYALPTHFKDLVPVLERMLSSGLPQVVSVGSRQACRSALELNEAIPLMELCLTASETETHRLAAAEIFGANLRSTQYREFCEEKLIQLFNDPDERVRDEAAKCFFKFEKDELGKYTNLIRSFVDSPAFIDNCHDLIYALKETTAKLPDITCLICEKFVDSFDMATADTRTSYAADSDFISELIIRVYSPSRNKALQSRCLNIIDRMAQLGIYGLDKALQQFER